MMMTKEEVIDAIIERYEGFENKGRINIFNCCPEIDCDYCPFGSRDCTNGIAMSLLDRLVKAEEKKETNLEHYIENVSAIGESSRVDSEIWQLYFKTGAEKAYKNSSCKDMLDWFLSPYEEPKPKYKLNQFEYDLIELHSGSKFGFKDFWILEHMQSKGYFKDIPKDVPIRDILDNCEVSD